MSDRDVERTWERIQTDTEDVCGRRRSMLTVANLSLAWDDLLIAVALAPTAADERVPDGAAWTTVPEGIASPARRLSEKIDELSPVVERDLVRLLHAMTMLLLGRGDDISAHVVIANVRNCAAMPTTGWSKGICDLDHMMISSSGSTTDESRDLESLEDAVTRACELPLAPGWPRRMRADVAGMARHVLTGTRELTFPEYVEHLARLKDRLGDDFAPVVARNEQGMRAFLRANSDDTSGGGR